jgi:hypothetical protein
MNFSFIHVPEISNEINLKRLEMNFILVARFLWKMVTGTTVSRLGALLLTSQTDDTFCGTLVWACKCAGSDSDQYKTIKLGPLCACGLQAPADWGFMMCQTL